MEWMGFWIAVGMVLAATILEHSILQATHAWTCCQSDKLEFRKWLVTQRLVKEAKQAGLKTTSKKLTARANELDELEVEMAAREKELNKRDALHFCECGQSKEPTQPSCDECEDMIS